MILRVECTVEVPSGIPLSEAIDWVKFQLQNTHSLWMTNPLAGREFEALTVKVEIVK